MSRFALLAILLGSCSVSFLACNGGGPGDADAGDGADAADAGDAADGGDDGPPPMQVGEISEILSGAGGVITAEIATPGGDESYILVLFSAAWEVGTEYGYEVVVTPEPPGGGILKKSKSKRDGMLAHIRPHAPWLLGGRRGFQVMDEDSPAVLDIEGECVLAGSSLAAWLDRTTTDPAPAAIDPDMLDDISAGFQQTVLPRHHIFFGEESDVDQDGLFHLLFTPIFASSGVIAYVSFCDLVNLFGCPIHNGMELVYATPPDQIGNPMMNSVSSILEITAHETQHSIYFHRKFILNNQPTAHENVYITEALSGLAEDLSGYGNGTFYVWAHTLDNIMDVSGPDLLDGSVIGYDANRDAALRGAGYLLYRYLFEQAGGNEFAAGNQITDNGGIAFLNALIDSVDLGQANLEQITSRSITDILFDWYTTLAVSNRKRTDGTALCDDSRYNYQPVTWDPDTLSSRGSPERHGVDLFSDNAMIGLLTGPVVTDVSEADGQIRAGGVDYLRVGASPAGSTLLIEITGEAGSDARLRIIREE